MSDEDIKRILRLILRSIKGRNFKWRLEGSVNLKIQGIDVSVNDLDITTNREGIEIFRDALRKFIVKDFFNQKINGHSLICKINCFKVEINAYNDKKLCMFNNTKKILWKGIFIPILPLKYAKEFYELIGRKEKIDLISRYL